MICEFQLAWGLLWLFLRVLSSDLINLVNIERKLINNIIIIFWPWPFAGTCTISCAMRTRSLIELSYLRLRVGPLLTVSHWRSIAHMYLLMTLLQIIKLFLDVIIFCLLGFSKSFNLWHHFVHFINLLMDLLGLLLDLVKHLHDQSLTLLGLLSIVLFQLGQIFMGGLSLIQISGADIIFIISDARSTWLLVVNKAFLRRGIDETALNTLHLVLEINSWPILVSWEHIIEVTVSNLMNGWLIIWEPLRSICFLLLLNCMGLPCLILFRIFIRVG